MIRIEKPDGPRILTGLENRGPKETQKMRDDFDTGVRDFEFKSDIYGAKSVKNALIKAQHGKCCFCESKFEHIAYGDVEHFRPKGGWIQSDGDPLTQPGYYWLAYDWDNLFASCQICNQRFKKNHFPIVDAAARALSHNDSIDDEDPLLPHPGHDDPEDWLTYDADGTAVAIDGTAKGEAMISIFGLSRDALVKRRLEVIEELAQMKTVYLLFQAKQEDGTLSVAEAEIMEDFANHFRNITQPDAEYSVFKKQFLSGVL